ncbi:hypothetical protein T552_03703 [Pneumocystis carinii B80]|uniref:Major surface glycoprotein 2 C-terminal domain-containing protein n=1 Tax=Pneumocystis carinii (strain B80) TaxID=1408658 RepID=A0A0W4ZAQ1_PNEC8|nr:hypothetical protein T552_03703 [Pneumocystis carinii B80]KTW25547.1 hypothetical protein T552_03703 [Pneumocystis carinii B80]
MARPVKRQAQGVQGAQDEIDEKHLLAFIAKDKYGEDAECKKRLKEYCDDLKKVDAEFKVNDKVKELCGGGDDTKRDEKCKTLKGEVKKELEDFENKLDASVDDIQDEYCEKYEEKCILLEEADPANLKDNCIELREGCYKLKREKVAEELLLRALGGDAKEAKCQEEMKKVCPMLSRESDELMTFCLDPSGTCGELKKKLKDLCEPLKEELKDGELEKKCHERLEKCHFYGEACDGAKCKDFEEKCKGKGITYKAPESDFSPVKPKASLLRSIGLDDVYKNAEKHGIIIGKSGVDVPRKSGTKFLQDLLLLLSRDEDKTDAKSKCDKALKKCETSKYLDTDLKKLCGDNDKQNKCEKMLDVKERCTKLKLNLYLKGLSTGYEDKKSDLLSWVKLPTFFIKGECAELESECFYLEKACNNKIDEACQNARAACYKKGQDRMLNKFFQKELRGNLGLVRYRSDPGDCKKYVVGNCTKLDKKYLPRCLYPKELCYALSNDIFLQSKELSSLLDDQRDFPLEKDCLELKEKCDELSSDSLLNLEKCITLKRRCEYFDVTERFRKVFLEKKDDSLMIQENCTKALHEKCEALSRRRKNSFSVSCALPEETCSYMVFHTSQDCKYLKENIKNGGIVGKIEKANGNETALEELCTTWGRHCHQLVENCPDQLKKENGNGNNHNCDVLQEKCNKTFEKLKAKDELTHLLKGSLKGEDECKKTLGKDCTKLQNNDTFKILLGECKPDTTENVCKELVGKAKERCLTLKDELKKAKDELTEMKTEYDKLKKAAEESTNKAKLLLSKSGKAAMPSGQDSNGSVPAPPAEPAPGTLPPPPPSTGGTSGTPGTPGAPGGTPGTPGSGTPNYAKLGFVKRAYVDEGVSEVEVKAFDATTIALELYLELKEECSALQLDCGFKEDCPESKSACEEIEKLCKLEALKVAPHHTETITNKVTETQTETKTVEKVDDKTNVKTVEKTITVTKPGSGGKVTEECTMIQTTDTWVTRTSLHTSTITSTSTVTSTVTLTSMRKCKPTKCTTDSSKETDKGEGKDEEEVKPNDGMKIRVPDMIKIMLLGVIVMGMM